MSEDNHNFKYVTMEIKLTRELEEIGKKCDERILAVQMERDSVIERLQLE
jgi:uncharacterized protein with PhoU and TrkA domain